MSERAQADAQDGPQDGSPDVSQDVSQNGSQNGEQAAAGGGWRRAWRTLAVIVGALAVLAALGWLAFRFALIAPPGTVVARDAHLRGEVVEIGARMDGRIARLHAEPGARVAEGETLVELAAGHLRAGLAEAEVELARLRARQRTARRALVSDRRLRDLAVEAAEAERRLGEAELAAAEATERRRRQQRDRVAALFDEQVASEARLEEARAAFATAAADRRERIAALAAARTELGRAEARRDALAVQELELVEIGHRIAAAEAARDRARADLADATLAAPRPGWIVETVARPGDSVRPGDPILTFWPAQSVRVRAWVSEEDATRIAPGQPARVTFDAFPGQPVLGAVEAVLIAPDGGPRRPPGTPVSPLLPDRTRFAVRILLDDGPPGRRLLPGLSATVRIDVTAPAPPGAGLPGPRLDGGR